MTLKELARELGVAVTACTGAEDGARHALRAQAAELAIAAEESLDLVEGNNYMADVNLATEARAGYEFSPADEENLQEAISALCAMPQAGNPDPQVILSLARPASTAPGGSGDLFTRTRQAVLAGLADKNAAFGGHLPVPLPWILEGPLGQACRNALKSRRDARTAGEAAAEKLASSKVISKELDAILLFPMLILDEVSASPSRPGPRRGARCWWPSAAAAQAMGQVTRPLLDEAETGTAVSAPAAGGVRIVALALAIDASRRGENAASKAFETVAAAITLAQRRAENPAEAGECVILAID